MQSLHWDIRSTVQFGPGQLQNTKILAITPWLAVKNLLPVHVRFRARSQSEFVPTQVILAGEVFQVHSRTLNGAADEWHDDVDGHPRIEPCSGAAVKDFQASISKAKRSTLVMIDNKSPFTLRRVAKDTQGTWGDTGKRFTEHWSKLGLHHGPPKLIRPNEMVVFGSDSIRTKFGDCQATFGYVVDGGVTDGRMHGMWKNPMINDPARGKWCHCKGSGALGMSVKGGKPTQESHNRVHFEVIEAVASRKVNRLLCQLASTLPIAMDTPDTVGDADRTASVLIHVGDSAGELCKVVELPGPGYTVSSVPMNPWPYASAPDKFEVSVYNTKLTVYRVDQKNSCPWGQDLVLQATPPAASGAPPSFDWSPTKFSLEATGAITMTVAGILDGAEVEVTVERATELAQFVATLRPAPLRPAQERSSEEVEMKALVRLASSPPLEVEGEVLVHRPGYHPWYDVEVVSEQPLPANPTFDFDAFWPENAKLDQNPSGSHRRYVQSIHCEAHVINKHTFQMMVAWPRWDPWDASAELGGRATQGPSRCGLTQTPFKVRWKATQGAAGISSSLNLKLELPDLRLRFVAMDHEDSIFSGNLVEHGQLRGDSGMELYLHDLKFAMNSMGKEVSVQGFGLQDGVASINNADQSTKAQPFLRFLQNEGLMAVHLGQKFKMLVTDDFILKATELVANFGRYSGNNRVTKLSTARAPSFMVGIVPGMRHCNAMGSVEMMSTSGTDCNRRSKQPSIGCTPPVVNTSGTTASRQVFPSVKLSAGGEGFAQICVDVDFHRKTNRGEHMFRTPLGPMPQMKIPLPVLTMRGCNFLDVAGDMSTVIDLVTVAQVGEAKRTIKGNIGFTSGASLLGTGAQLIGAGAVGNIKALRERGAGLDKFDKYGFTKETGLDRKKLLTKHNTAAMYCTSADMLWKQAINMAFDWNVLNANVADVANLNAKSCAVLVLENHSSVPIVLQSMDAKVGLSGGLSTLVGQGPGCEASNCELQPIGAAGWASASCSLVFAWGTRLSEVTCCVKSTAFECEVGGLDGNVQMVNAKEGFHVVWERKEISGLWNVYQITVLDDGTVDGGGGYVEVYENQRRVSVFGIGKDFCSKDLMKTERGPWSDEPGNTMYRAGLEDVAILPKGAAWVAGSAWQEAAWEHAFNFPGKLVDHKWTVWSQHPSQLILSLISLACVRWADQAWCVRMRSRVVR